MPKVKIIPDNKGKPLYVLIKYEDYLAAKEGSPKKAGRPAGKTAGKVASAKVSKSVASGIAACRERVGLTKAEMARRLGVTAGGYAFIEKSQKPRPETLAKVAKAMGVSVAKLSG